jgi:predicted Fe-Mo cluster-binding NifX family protein
MRVVLPNHEDRISPVLDVARRFVLVDAAENQAVARREVRIEETALVAKAKRIMALRPDVVICGAISRAFDSMLASSGIRVIGNTCGPVDEVIDAFLAGGLTDGAFLMPGCTGRCRRRRQRLRRGGIR